MECGWPAGRGVYSACVCGGVVCVCHMCVCVALMWRGSEL